MLQLMQEIVSEVGPHGETYELEIEITKGSVYLKITHPTLGIISTVKQDGQLPEALDAAVIKAKEKWLDFRTRATHLPEEFRVYHTDGER